MNSNFQAVSLSGEVHWADIHSQVGNAQEFEVRALDAGQVVVLHCFKTTQKWAVNVPICGHKHGVTVEFPTQQHAVNAYDTPRQAARKELYSNWPFRRRSSRHTRR